MGWGAGNLGGGGGDISLNFKVVGNPQPETAKENTIWVDAETISGWVFSATEPEAPQDNMVWFQTGTVSGAEFNALKKNGIQVYPLSAKQYISGAWVDKTAKIYQDGWVEWVQTLYLLKDGVFESGYEFEEFEHTRSTITFVDGAVIFKNTAKDESALYCKKKIDVTNYRTVRIAITGGVSYYPIYFGFVASKTIADTARVNIFDVASATFEPVDKVFGVAEQTIDLSSVSGEMWFGFIYSGSSNVTNSSTYGYAGIKVTDITFE